MAKFIKDKNPDHYKDPKVKAKEFGGGATRRPMPKDARKASIQKDSEAADRKFGRRGAATPWKPKGRRK